MSDVKRYYANCLSGEQQVVLAADFDALAAKLVEERRDHENCRYNRKSNLESLTRAEAKVRELNTKLADHEDRIATLESERDEWRKQAGIGVQSQFDEGRIYLARIATLEAALRRYEKHDPNRCFVTGDVNSEPEIICHCGLRAASHRRSRREN